MDDRPIGFFDSGLGGLTCIPYLMKALPNERIVYFGDTARTPYGSKAVSTIRNFAFEITDFLAAEKVKMIVIACNTVSATCLSDLRERHPQLPVLGIISPAAHTVAASCTDSNRVGVIGTKATIESEAYRDEIRKLAPGLKIFETACPVFVPLIEEGIINDAIMDLSIRHYLDDFLLENGIDTLVLGCTHYPLIKENIVRLYPDISVIDPSAEIIPSIADSLAKYGLLCDGTGTLKTPIQSVAEDGSRIGDRDARHGFDQRPLKAGHVFYASDLSENFVNMIEPIFEGSGFTVAFKNFDLEQAV